MPVHLIDHPVAQDALLVLRDVETSTESFRRAARRISTFLAVEALRDVPVRSASVATPFAQADGSVIASDIVVIPVLRAGLGMLDAVLDLVPGARVGHVGLQRDEATARPSQYYARLPPDLSASYVLMIDPMLATGGSAVAAIDLLKRAGARMIRLACIVAAPDGIARVTRHHPDVDIFAPAIDRGLDSRKFIVPGLGDFGDRLYGTTPTA